MKKRYVYLMQSTRTGEYKIGVSKNPQIRKKALETGHGSPIEIKHIFLTDYPFAVEAQLHVYFREQRCDGEFFKLNPDDITQFNYLCELYDKCLTKQDQVLDW